MMDQKKAKVPEDLNEWEGIDIYLFTNGQQFTPPRKFHLKSQDLASWESLLDYLAQAQYDDMHSKIDLYTIEGKKISSPLELGHGFSYVAVKHDDMFIKSGYEQYLMKASRSWQKRYGRGGSLKSDDKYEIQKLSRISTNLEGLNEQSPTKTEPKTGQLNCDITVKDQGNKKPNFKYTSKIKGQTNRNVTSTKSMEKVNISVANCNNTSRKTIQSASVPTRNLYLKKNNISTKENLKLIPNLNKRASIKPVNYNKTKVNKSNTASKTLIRAKELCGTFVIPANVDELLTHKNSTLIKSPDPDNKHVIGKVSEVKVNQKKIVSNSYNDIEAVTKLHSSEANSNNVLLSTNTHEIVLQVRSKGSLTPIYIPNNDIGLIDDDENKTFANEIPQPFIDTGNNINPLTLLTKNNGITHSKSKIQVVSKIDSDTIKKKCDLPITNSLIALIDQRHIVRLKISVEVKKDRDTVDRGQQRNMGESRQCNERTLDSLRENKSQINFNEAHIPNIQQIFTKEYNQTDQNAVLIYCNCSNASEGSTTSCKLHIVPAIVKNEDKELENIVELLHLPHKINGTGCSGKEIVLKADKQVETSKSIEKIVFPGHTNICNTFPEKVLQIVTISNADNSAMKHTTVASQEVGNLKKQEAMPENDTENTKFRLATKDILNTSCKILLNKYTQTNTNNLLLEARHREGSYYSFYLPPLNVLKCYNLQ